ncbi:hypothetical protein PV11_06616 [Exophiala sideris]|uniref:2'-phosphotransferase n=1 Tax=Exophiala sideris TaxID=1016849 RepID=A0A0D1VSJ1_9EURO|nr:hypothetical protein PV11_06616 [Exophiala sideris]
MSSGRGGRGGRGGNRHDSQPRTVLVSKALSRLLRHAAVQERIPIDKHGYIRIDHLLGWQRLRSMKPPVTFDEVVDVVQDNEKKRFALKFVTEEINPEHADVPASTSEGAQADTETEAETETETQRAISQFEALRSDNDIDTKKFFIRATQGHSMKAVEAENLLTPITLDDEASIPDAVVHGTFYGAWEPILESGGLKPMSRNHVHFATGPSMDEVQQHTVPGETTKGGLGSVLGKNKVISGMRSDAQILIYVDIRRALIEEKEMKWWRSENGVILTEGVGEKDKIVPTKYFSAAYEIKEGVGKVWEDGKVVKELPENLRSRPLPRGKGVGGQRGRGRGGGRGQ